MSDNENLLAEARVSLHRGVASKYAWEVFANLVAALEQADRWLASVKADAWAEGAYAALEEEDECIKFDFVSETNPYRGEQA
jgi:malate synthase